MQMKSLLAVLLPVKGSYIGYGAGGALTEIAKCALLGRVNSRLPPPSFVPAAVRGTSARTTCGRLASETFRESGAGTHLIPTSSCRAAIKLYGVINGLRRFTAAKKATSRTNVHVRTETQTCSLSLSLWISIPISSSVDRNLVLLIITMRIIWHWRWIRPPSLSGETLVACVSRTY